MLALSCIVRSKAVGQGCNDVQETVSLITRVCEAAEGHLLCSAGNGNNEGMSICGDFNLLLACLQRLINAAVSIMMEIDPTSHLMFRLFQLWETIRISLSHISVERECIEFIVGATMFPTEALPFRTSALYLRTVCNHRLIFFCLFIIFGCRSSADDLMSILKYCWLLLLGFVL